MWDLCQTLYAFMCLYFALRVMEVGAQANVQGNTLELHFRIGMREIVVID